MLKSKIMFLSAIIMSIIIVINFYNYVVFINGGEKGNFHIGYGVLDKPLFSNVTLHDYMDEYYNKTLDVPVILHREYTYFVNDKEAVLVFANNPPAYGIVVSKGDVIRVNINITNYDDKAIYAVPYITIDSPNYFMDRGIDVYMYRWGVTDVYIPEAIELLVSPYAVKVSPSNSKILILEFKIVSDLKPGKYLILIGVAQIYNINGVYYKLEGGSAPLVLIVN